MKKTIALILATLITTGVSSGQIATSQSAGQLQNYSNLQNNQKLFTKENGKRLILPATLIVAGTAMYGNPGKKFQNLRDNYTAGFSTGFDEYLQYAPVAMLYGMKISGIEGKSDWVRLITTNAISAVIMAGTVNAIKYTVKEPRPDGSRDNGFPSGHTALAFMSAAMVHHEYGMTRSPWYSVAAYGIASSTAVMRVMNNSHYVHDVIMGSGMGILSTELGYMFADLIFGEKRLLREELKETFIQVPESPYSYLGSALGFTKIQGVITMSGREFRAFAGTSASVEGAFYFRNRTKSDKARFANSLHAGISVNATINNSATYSIHPIIAIYPSPVPTFNWYSISAGPVISARAGNLFRYGVSAEAGYAGLKENNFGSYVHARGGISLGGSLFIERHITDGIIIRAFARSSNAIFKNSPDLPALSYGGSVAVPIY
ncbi:MAG: hypothetical protein CVT97_05210 [Bacteroidetes bacterium HGW-Bacteroidetes-14]|nr:MAG: hypothetical protein CVT97_05210 [Bacteroidetes bacterium HGW-Bacteroidetes-14]